MFVCFKPFKNGDIYSATLSIVLNKLKPLQVHNTSVAPSEQQIHHTHSGNILILLLKERLAFPDMHICGTGPDLSSDMFNV